MDFPHISLIASFEKTSQKSTVYEFFKCMIKFRSLHKFYMSGKRFILFLVMDCYKRYLPTRRSPRYVEINLLCQLFEVNSFQWQFSEKREYKYKIPSLQLVLGLLRGSDIDTKMEIWCDPSAHGDLIFLPTIKLIQKADTKKYFFSVKLIDKQCFSTSFVVVKDSKVSFLSLCWVLLTGM